MSNYIYRGPRLNLRVFLKFTLFRLRSVVTADGLLREYNSERHGGLLLDGIGDVFLARQFTDVVVKIGETEIKAHK